MASKIHFPLYLAILATLLLLFATSSVSSASRPLHKSSQLVARNVTTRGYATRSHFTSKFEKRGFSGDGTFFTPDQDACFNDHTSSHLEFIAALSPPQFGTPKNDNSFAPACFKCLKVTHKAKSGKKTVTKSIVLKVTDECASCSKGDVDMTDSAFKKLAPLSQGRIKISWSFTSCSNWKRFG